MSISQRSTIIHNNISSFSEQATKKVCVIPDQIVKETEDVGNSNSSPTKGLKCLGFRHIFAFMGFLGIICFFVLRVAFSVAIVAMVRPVIKNLNNKSSSIAHLTRLDNNNTSNLCPLQDIESDSLFNRGEFDWNNSQKGLVLGCFYWGYMVTQLPGGILAEKIGGKYIFGGSIFLMAVFSIFTPLAARSSVTAAIVVQTLSGLAGGGTIPAINSMLSKWVPKPERSTLGTLVYAGTPFGTVIGLPLLSVLCEIELDNGWPWAFYVPGMMGVTWFFLWSFLISESPEDHRYISEREKCYIMESTGRKTAAMSLGKVPWKSLLTSVRMWAITVAHTGSNWGFYMLLTELPSYMDSVLHFNLKSNGLLSALPYLVMWIVSIFSSILADALRKRCFSTTTIRKMFTAIGLISPACALVGAAYTGCDSTSTVALITLAAGLNGAVYSGFLVNHVDIACNYAGIMMGISNCFGSIGGFLAPYVVNAIVTEPGSLLQWKIVFFISAGVYVSSCLFYIVFGTGVEQSWNNE